MARQNARAKALKERVKRAARRKGTFPPQSSLTTHQQLRRSTAAKPQVTKEFADRSSRPTQQLQWAVEKADVGELVLLRKNCCILLEHGTQSRAGLTKVLIAGVGPKWVRSKYLSLP